MIVGMRNAVQNNEMRELASSDDENWQEKEASRTHSVKFTDDGPEADKEVSMVLITKHSASAHSEFAHFFRHFCCMNTTDSFESINSNVELYKFINLPT